MECGHNELSRDIQSTVKKDGGCQRFKSISQVIAFAPAPGCFLTPAQQQVVSQFDLRRLLGKLFLPDQGNPDFSQLSLG